MWLNWLFGKKIKTPSKKWFEEVSKTGEYTPDVAFLEKKIAHRVFLYDNLMEKRPFNEVLGHDSYKISNALTQDSFTFWNTRSDKSKFVVPLRSHADRAPMTRIKGEMHLVPTERILYLDKILDNGVMYRRTKVRLLIPFVPPTNVQVNDRTMYEKAVEATIFLDKPVSAWMYIGVDDCWSDLLEKGTKIKFTDRLGQVTYSNISEGMVISPVRSFKNKKLGLYYYYTPHEFTNNK